MGDLREVKGVVLEGSLVWDHAEVATMKIIRQVQPTVVSEERRKDVVDYVQRLLKGYLSCEVFPFGSVPLKTYLPDGDIDLTAFCGFNFEEGFANEVYSVLVAEDRNPAAKFIVKDVQYIHAEVKLVKCLVQNIVVDISFNQIGGLCALGFLEEIDRLIAKDHLFKRSIILIKAWCYYESRILGAHHGLISTYALETLVLYIFHLFHTSLNGPLAVLHKFLDYFSKFDWENFCVSLSGPVRVASLPKFVVERPETSGRVLLLSDDFMRECVRDFSVPSRGAETNNKTFVPKHLNIVDPLKENNNLGRSVNRGNFVRIRSAFSYGARKLGQILLLSQENVAEEVRMFFANTLDRHGNGQRPDVYEILRCFDEPYRDQFNFHEEDSVYCNNQSSESSASIDDANHVLARSFMEAGTKIEGTQVEDKIGSKEFSDSENRLLGDASEMAISGFRDLRITGLDHAFHPFVLEEKQLWNISQSLENGKMENGHFNEDQHRDSSPTCSEMVNGCIHPESNGFMSWKQDTSRLCNDNDHLASSDSWQDSNSECRITRLGGTRRQEIANILPDLSGDFDSHLDSLHHGRWLYDQALSMPIHVMPPMFQSNVSWDTMHHPTVQLRPVVGPHMTVNGVIPRPIFLPANPPVTRGLGTFIPDMSPHSNNDRPSPKGRYQGPLKSPRRNGRPPMLFDRNFQAQGPFRPSIGRPKYFDHHKSSPRAKGYQETNGFVQAPEKVFEHDAPRNPSPEAEIYRSQNSDPSPESPDAEPVLDVDDSRLSVESYRLKDDEDFPPLCA